MHAASDTLKEWLYEWNKYHPDQPLYAIKADIHHYFQSIDHAVLKTEIRKVIKDAGVLALLDRIIDHNGQYAGRRRDTSRKPYQSVICKYLSGRIRPVY